MSDASKLGLGRDIAKGEHVETLLTLSATDGIDGKENCPGEGPDWDEDLDHKTKEPDEEVRVEAVAMFDVRVICSDEIVGPDEGRPLGARKRILAFPGWIRGVSKVRDEEDDETRTRHWG